MLRAVDQEQRDAAVRRAVAALRRGGVIAFPTDTVYGVGAALSHPDAIARIYTIKERPPDKPLQVLLADVGQIPLVARAVPGPAQRLAARFLPGGLTLVLWRTPAVPDVVTTGGETVAVRVPDHPLFLALARALGEPVVATSANRSGQPSPVTAEEVAAQLGGRVDLILDGGRCPMARDSTVLDLTVSPPRVLREGAVPRAALEEVCGPLAAS
ncbi:MAG: threonylcarbamoyl-AMP synthase [Chloroflexi bacterium]|nr:threonylcarbamoyl-AMP synthase [Chloroflexota bacterium]